MGPCKTLGFDADVENMKNYMFVGMIGPSFHVFLFRYKNHSMCSLLLFLTNLSLFTHMKRKKAILLLFTMQCFFQNCFY